MISQFTPVKAAMGSQALVASQSLRAEIVTDLAGLAELRSAWDALHAATKGTNPFTQWTWVHRWWEVFAQRGGAERDRLHIITLRDEQGVARAIIPFVLSTWGWGKLSLRVLRLYGYNGSFTEIRAPLVWPGWEEEAGRALVETLHARRRTFHWCLLDGLLEGSPFERWFATHAEAMGWSWEGAVPDYVMPLRETWDAFRGGLKRNIKESLRHCYNSLKREGHTYHFETIDDPAKLPAAIDDFIRLHAARAAMQDGQAHPDHYATADRRRFLHRIAQDLGAEGRIMACRLHINGELVASRMAFEAGDTVYLYYSGYDPAWSRYSVMTTLTAECIKMAIERGKRAVNLSTGTDVSKTRWGPDELRFRSLRMLSPTLEARTIIAAQERGLQVSGLVAAARRRLAQGGNVAR